MPTIVSVPEFASFRQEDVDTATATLLLDLAEGLVTDEIGTQSPWPAAARGTVLAAANRPYRNPDNLIQAVRGGTTDQWSAEEMGVYLTAGEKDRLHRWLERQAGADNAAPVGSFPAARSWPDPFEPDL